MITVNEFYTRARWVPLIVPASCIGILYVVSAIMRGGSIGTFFILLLWVAGAGVCYVVPYGVFLIVVPRYLTPKSEWEWRRVELLTPLCIAAVFAVAIVGLVGLSD